MNKSPTIRFGLVAAAAAMAVALVSCGSGDGGSSSSGASALGLGGTQTAAGDVPIAYVKRADSLNANPTGGAPSAPGGDLMVRELSSPSAKEYNLTAQFTQGHGDASDPEVSYDGKKIVFSMLCPTSNTATINGQPACTGRWNIWEYDMTTGGLAGGTFRRITSSTDSDDVDPVYLPAGRGFVFSSNRQGTSSKKQINGRTYFALDEYERERVFNLHTMDANGGAITQISVNQSHDRNPVIRPNGDIMFSRWDHVGGRNHFKIFRAKPDGTDMFVLYGAHSEGNSFLHPRDMDPKGKFKGFVASDLMPLSRTHEGGSLVFVDAANYSEQNTPASPTVAATGGQSYPAQKALSFGGGISRWGRVTTPFPLWDGTDRVLLAYTPCQVRRAGIVVSCATLTDAEMARLTMEERTIEQIQADELQDNVRPAYAIYMFDPSSATADQQWRPVAVPEPGFMYTDPVPIVPRTEPSALDPTAVDPTLAAQGLGLLEVRSVYDTDGLGRMGDAVLGPVDLQPGCTTAIAKTTPSDPQDTRPLIPDLKRMKDPADAAYRCGPARFIRVFRAVAPPSGSTGMRGAIGETDFEMQQILGYAPIEPDGSFKLQVPADTPIGLAVVDEQGRAFQTHTNWIQVRPGERRTCDGCHSPRRGGAINSGSVADSIPSSWLASMASAHLPGETMAGTRTRLDANAIKVVGDLLTADIWADPQKATPRPAITIRYTGNTDPADDLQTPAPTNGTINYPEHIAPLWTRDRGTNTCTTCHNDPAKLDLRSTMSGAGRMVSYQELLVGDPVIDPATNQPVIVLREGVPMVQRQAALVENGASEGDAGGLSRRSRLMEIMSGQTLMADAGARASHPNPPPTAPDHSKMLTRAEKRLIAEWMDLGGQYYNDPYNGNVLRTIAALDEQVFTAQIQPILNARCIACHQPVGSTATGTAASFAHNRFVLTGDTRGDFGVTVSMVGDTCTPATSYLLAKPSTLPHPMGAATQTTPPLPAASADYQTVFNWIKAGCKP